MSRRMDLSGQRFGRWVVVEYARTSNRKVYWSVRCDCGTEKIVKGDSLKCGDSRSCGCLVVDTNVARLTTHGMATRDGKTKAYTAWEDMRQRCLNPLCLSYPRYGGRGISICARWDSFEYFLSDMGNP